MDADEYELAGASDRTLEKKIVKALKSRRGRATLADVVVDTGIPNMEVERMLRRMIGEYPCHLDVNEDGDILYAFERSMRRYDEREWIGRFARRTGEAAWAGFSKFMKALIAIVMVLYVVIFVCLIIAAMLAAARGGGNRRTSLSRRHGGGGGFWFWYWVFGRPNDRYRTHRYHNPAYSRFGGRRKGKGKDPRPFYMKVFSFVLGPETGDVDPVVNDVALLAFIRQQKGAVTTAEIASRTGWTLERSEQALTRMVARYEGNLAISDEGQLVFTFPDLLKTIGSKKVTPAKAFWDRYETAMPLTGNTTGSNWGISALNGFNLITAAMVPTAILPALQWPATTGVLFLLHWFPMGFSVLIFAIPTLRWLLRVVPENRRRQKRNLRRVAYQQIFDAVHQFDTALIDPAAAVEAAADLIPSRAYTPNATTSHIRSALEESLGELGCELVVDEETGEIAYSVAHLVDALGSAELTRQSLKKHDGAVRIVYSTGEDEHDVEMAEEPSEARTLH
jgi:hypothetical protein